MNHDQKQRPPTTSEQARILDALFNEFIRVRHARIAGHLDIDLSREQRCLAAYEAELSKWLGGRIRCSSI